MSEGRLGRMVGCAVVLLLICGGCVVLSGMKRQLERLRAAQASADPAGATGATGAMGPAAPRSPRAHETDKPKLPPGTIW